MNIEVLVSTMHQQDLSLVEKMNIRTNAVLINQCDNNDVVEAKDDEKCIKMYSFRERGVGKSRNIALIRATGDICIMADDDVVYLDHYEQIVRDAFAKNPNADMIMFNVTNAHEERNKRDKVNTKNKRVRFYNCLRYGTYNIAFRRERLLKHNVFFSLLFGGGAAYGSGEDTLFIWECLKKGLIIYASPAKIADVYHQKSTWFSGHNEKYYFDRGVLFEALSKCLAIPLMLRIAILEYKQYKDNMTFFQACKFMLRGISHYQSL
ncbi:glycosyltransferase [Pelosinus baikalensis]|uniref:Glycosyltransferase family 2 protein n=1 Tax=Pelosinus baikalensis TaxID=2892015 RepID=A0ABS8HNF6_9FIRM|nr:glycosyltransferase family A protein [Pelosinus baikalensis]MCC5464084.1 glycosyltransferase family 2 protein [Pelosinus baikalensis]